MAKAKSPRRLVGGFFSVERRVLQEDMRGDGPLYLIWTTLIAWANIADGKEKLRGQQVIVKRGQVATGVRELAREWKLAHSTVQRCLRYLEDTGRISTEAGTHGTIITVVKYDDYQRPRKEAGTVSRTGPAPDPHITGTPSVPSEQGNKGTREPDNVLPAPEPVAEKPGKKSKSLLQEAHTVGALLFIPTDHGGETRRRFVSVSALNACVDEALDKHGIEVFREMLALAKRERTLGRWVFDANKFPGLCDQVAATLAGKRANAP